MPLGFPALTRALKLQKRAARAGFDWGAARPILAKLREEIDELEEALDEAAPEVEQELELGDLLFTVVNLARHLALDPEAAPARDQCQVRAPLPQYRGCGGPAGASRRRADAWPSSRPCGSRQSSPSELLRAAVSTQSSHAAATPVSFITAWKGTLD